MLNVSSQACEGIGQIQVAIQFVSSLQRRGFFNKSGGTFCILAGMRGFGRHKLRCILCPFGKDGLSQKTFRCILNSRWHRTGLGKTV